MYWLAIAGGGAVGALLRYATSIGAAALFGRAFPFGTLIANVAGSLCIGLLFAYSQQSTLAPEWRAALQIGLLGAFTTFSTFSLETLHMFNNGDFSKALANVLLNLVLCLGATWLGLLLGRRL